MSSSAFLPPNIPAAKFASPDLVEWQDAPGYGNPGAREKILFNDPDTGAYVRLLRWPAGFVSGDEPLCHREFHEFAWIVEGVSIDQSTGDRYEPGTFCVVPVGVLHGPFETPDGVTLLEMRQPVSTGGEA
jgi:hypothetical protein